MSINTLYNSFYILSIVGIVTIATLVYLRRKGAEYTAFFVFSLALALWLTLQFVAQLQEVYHIQIVSAELLLRLATALAPLLGVLFFIFAKAYTSKQFTATLHFIVPVLGGIFIATTPYVVKSTEVSSAGIAVQVTPFYYAVGAFAAIYMIPAVWDILQQARRRRLMPTKRQSAALMFAGVIQALILVLFATLAFPTQLLSQLAIPVSLFLMLVIFGYAIVKHSLFDIRLALARTLTYLLLLATLLAMYTAAVFALLQRLIGHEVMTPLQNIAYIGLAVLLSFTYTPLRRFFNKITDRIFFQHAYDTQRVLDQLGNVAVEEINLAKLAHKSLHVLNSALKFEGASVYVVSKKRAKPYIFSVGNPLSNLEVAAKLFNRLPAKAVVADLLDDDKIKMHTILKESAIAVAVRLETHDEVLGYLVLRPKQDGSGYNVKDVQLLRTVGDELAVAIQNSLRFQEIEDFTHTLQDRIEQATYKLRESNKKLRALDEAKDEFISMASHQMRTPLTSVKGYVSMVLDGDAGRVSPEQHKLLNEAYNSAQRMVYLISDFLDVSRIHTGRFTVELKSVKLTDIIRDEINQLAVTAKSRGITLIWNLPSSFPALMLDEDKMRQVIMNFIDNAIYYTPAGGTITVNLTHTDKEVTFEVHDTGIGVPKNEQHHLFTKFFRASNALRIRPDGTGIGLFLAKKVVALQGGAIIFHSKEGEGSTFGFRFTRKKH